MVITAVIIFAIIGGVFASAAFWINWLWFGSVGYRSVIMTRYLWQVTSFLTGALVAGVFTYANIRLAFRRSTRPSGLTASSSRQTRGLRAIVWAVSLAFAILAGSWAGANWETWLLLVQGTSFGVDDPTFHRDIGFYLFSLPAIQKFGVGLMFLLAGVSLTVAAIYLVRFGLGVRRARFLPGYSVNHLAALIASALAFAAAGFWLANYRLVYSNRGAVYGPGFTDLVVVRWINILIALVTLALAVVVVSPQLRSWRRIAVVAIAWMVLVVPLRALIPSAVQAGIVEPSEYTRERPNIERNIEMTRLAFGLSSTLDENLSGQGEPLPGILTSENELFRNVRLWDYRVILDAFQQIRSFVPYYRFLDVDVDRYALDGQVRQTLVSARELDVEGLPDRAQTWVNRHLVFTHGYGLAVSPVSEATQQGLPRFLVGEIPPEGTGTLAVERPEIYFGESRAEWVAVNTRLDEFSGLDTNAPDGRYAGAARGSIDLGSYLNRILTAAHLQDRRIMLSSELTTDSRILLRRGIAERIATIAPFLTLDPDPYLIVADGRLVWLVDAYTTSDLFPSSRPIEGINYIRNSVKVTVDAYDGTTIFYRTNVADPIADSYASIYSDLYTPISRAPAAISSHFRYPERLFDLQADVLTAYHVTDPRTFYNEDDRWAVPFEQVGEQRSRMESYYVTLPLPGSRDPVFGLVLPFVPGGRQDRQNMTAWLAGESDLTGETRLTVYRFPRQVTVFGPEQIAARISQDPDIKNRTALLGQAGSRVIRGHMLVIPIDQTVMYIQPLYVQSTGTTAAPTELKFVIVATNERVVMRASLPEALQALAAEAPAVADVPIEPSVPSEPSATSERNDIADQALAAFERARSAYGAGDWTSYGKEQAIVEDLLRQMANATPVSDPTAMATPTP